MNSETKNKTTPGGNQSARGYYPVKARVADVCPLDSGGGKSHAGGTGDQQLVVEDSASLVDAFLKDTTLRTSKSRSSSVSSARSAKRVRVDDEDDPGSGSEVGLNTIKKKLDTIRGTFMTWWTSGDTKVKLNKADYARLEESYQETWDLMWTLALENQYLHGRIDRLEDEAQQRAERDTHKPDSYSERLKKAPPVKVSKGKKKRPAQSYTVVVSGEALEGKEKIEGAELKKKVFDKLHPVKDNLHVNYSRTLQNGSLIIETRTKGDMDKVLAVAPELVEDGIKLQEKQKRLPRIIIYDVPNDYDEQYVMNAIELQNEHIWSDGSPDLSKAMKFLFKMGKSREDCSNLVYEVHPGIRKRLSDEGKIYIGMYRSKVQDFVKLTRCYKCQGVAHVSKYCKQEHESCAYCAGEHASRDCTDKESKKCALCKRLGKASDHKSGENCPSYKQALKIYSASIDYG
uniref:CCHC-type domain-containing protein n=1 Tax=Trichogramma kaykai TaxID=54128 RepID=A0ABD2VR13_9HYME